MIGIQLEFNRLFWVVGIGQGIVSPKYQKSNIEDTKFVNLGESASRSARQQTRTHDFNY